MIASPPGIFSPIIVIHTAAAGMAFLLGLAMFLRRKGSRSHRLLGRAWVALMVVIIFSSFFIRTHGSFSWIHALSVGTLIMLIIAVQQARLGNVAAHRGFMTGIFAGSLIIAGIFTLLPSRLLGWHLWHALGWIG